jgi:pimeloyl-ACP methyl ester carboxylesterase
MAGGSLSTDLRSQSDLVPLLGRSVEAALHQHPAASDTILLLHEALGSVTYWKDFPEKLALATGTNVLLYSRAGQGNSEGPLPPRNRESYLREAQEVIPALLEYFQVDRPIVYGHSEGAGLAMLYAGSSQRAKMLILESPFVVALESSHRLIQNMAANYPGSRLQQRLALYHQDADAVFASWVAGIDTLHENESPFEDFLPRISCPVLVLQGANDEFGTTRHLDALLSALPQVEHETFADTGHLPHRQQTEAVLDRVSRFIAKNRQAATA